MKRRKEVGKTGGGYKDRRKAGRTENVKRNNEMAIEGHSTSLRL